MAIFFAWRFKSRDGDSNFCGDLEAEVAITVKVLREAIKKTEKVLIVFSIHLEC